MVLLHWVSRLLVHGLTGSTDSSPRLLFEWMVFHHSHCLGGRGSCSHSATIFGQMDIA
jgi:hypothetical protein